MSWYNSNWKDRYPVAVEVLGGAGGGSATNEDIEVIIPSDWDHFWNNIRADGFDIILTTPGGTLLTFKRVTFHGPNRLCTLQADNVPIGNNDSINLVYLYYNNPDQSSDLASVFTGSSLKPGKIVLTRPSSNAINSLSVEPGTVLPVASFQKTIQEEIYIWFRVGSILSRRISTNNDHLTSEEISYVKVTSLDSAGADDATRYSEASTRFIPGWVGVKALAGANNTDYTLALEIVTTATNFSQKYSSRALIRVRELLPT
tara:strand:+ start:1678 stop:2454 length:777 start_codon:yes stop_codon:yes gene_type:complete